VAAIRAPAYIICLPSILLPNDGKSTLTKLSNIDWTGSTETLVSLVMVLTFAGATWEWDDGRTIALFIVFGTLLSLLIAQQRFNVFTSPDNRMFLPSRLLRSRSQVLMNIEIFVFSGAIFVLLYYILNYFQFIHSDSAIMAAVRSLPFVTVFVVTNIFSGILLPKIGY
jgi:hypothetical protein